MECPKCEKEAKVFGHRKPFGRFTVHREYLCACGFKFKTSEKILFTTLPKAIRDKYLDGRMDVK